MNYMIDKIIAIQGNHPSSLNPLTDTSIFLAHEIQNKKYKIFYYEPKNLSILNSKVIANKTTNADHMITKFSKNEDLNELYDK